MSGAAAIETSEQNPRAGRIRLLFWVVGLAVSVVQGWVARHDVMLDGVAYLDLARALAGGDWRAFVNSYWSPGYPALLALALRLLPAPGVGIFLLPRLVNVFIFAAMMAAFELYWRELGALRARAGGFPAWAWQVFGYSLFLWTALGAIGTWIIEADGLMAVFLLLAAALLLRVRRTGRWADFALWGIVLGAAYLAKVAMFPIALLMMTLVAIGGWRDLRRIAPPLLLAAVIFALLAAPWMGAMRARYQRWTFGDSAALNYAWFVNGVQMWFHWQGGPPGRGMPLHPARQIWERPEAFEYATPVGGTFPLWDDPGYWYAGVEPGFNWREQADALLLNLKRFPYRSQMGVVAAFLLLAGMAWRDGSLTRIFATAWPVWLAGAAGIGMLMLVHAEPRHLGGLLLLFWSGLFAGVELSQRRVMVGALLLAAVSFQGAVVFLTLRAYRETELSRQQFLITQSMPQALGRAGIVSGDPLVSVGGEAYYWVLPAQVRVVGDIEEGEVMAFWHLTSARRAELLAKFAATGAKAVVAGPITMQAAPAGARVGWQPLGDTGFALYPLRAAKVSSTSPK